MVKDKTKTNKIKQALKVRMHNCSILKIAIILIVIIIFIISLMFYFEYNKNKKLENIALEYCKDKDVSAVYLWDDKGLVEIKSSVIEGKTKYYTLNNGEIQCDSTPNNDNIVKVCSEIYNMGLRKDSLNSPRFMC